MLRWQGAAPVSFPCSRPSSRSRLRTFPTPPFLTWLAGPVAFAGLAGPVAFAEPALPVGPFEPVVISAFAVPSPAPGGRIHQRSCPADGTPAWRGWQSIGLTAACTRSPWPFARSSWAPAERVRRARSSAQSTCWGPGHIRSPWRGNHESWSSPRFCTRSPERR